jgi:acid stress-induced BolA-like protein IbaG/YrbA
MTPETIHQLLQQGLPCSHLQVEGDGRHFYAIIVSTAFEGLSRVRRHQTVYSSLGDYMQEAIHALSMQTFTPQEWEMQRG